MIEWILFLLIALFIYCIFSGRTIQQLEFLLVGISNDLTLIKRRLEDMPSKADLDAAIAALNQTITDEATKLQAAIDALAAAAASGGDLTAEIAAIQAAQARIAALPTTPTPPAP